MGPSLFSRSSLVGGIDGNGGGTLTVPCVHEHEPANGA